MNVKTIPGTLELYKNMNLQTEMSFFALSPVSGPQFLPHRDPSRALKLQHDGPMSNSMQGGKERLKQSTHS